GRRPSVRGRPRHLRRNLVAVARADRSLVRARVPGPAGGAGRSRLVGPRARRLLGLPPPRAKVDLPAGDRAPPLGPGARPRLEAACMRAPRPGEPAAVEPVARAVEAAGRTAVRVV